MSHCYCPNNKSSRPEAFCKKSVLRNFAKFTGKHLCQSLFFIKVAGLRSATLLKKKLWHRFFPMNFAKFLRTPFLQNTSGGCFCNNLCFFTLQYFVTTFLIPNCFTAIKPDRKSYHENERDKENYSYSYSNYFYPYNLSLSDTPHYSFDSYW